MGAQSYLSAMGPLPLQGSYPNLTYRWVFFKKLATLSIWLKMPQRDWVRDYQLGSRPLTNIIYNTNNNQLSEYNQLPCHVVEKWWGWDLKLTAFLEAQVFPPHLLFWTECLHNPKIICWTPNSHHDGIWRCNLWEVIRVRWGHEGGILMMGLAPL